MAFRVGDKVTSPQYSDTIWAGEMTVIQTYSTTGTVSCAHPTAGQVVFSPSQLVLVEAAKVSVKDAIALLQAEGYTVSAPYWESKAVRIDNPHSKDLIIGWVDKDSVQIGTGQYKTWISFEHWDAFAKVVEEAKEFNRKYRP